MARGQPLGGGAEKVSSEVPHGGKAQNLHNVEVGGLGGASDDATLRFQVTFVRIRSHESAGFAALLDSRHQCAHGAATSLDPHTHHATIC